METQNQLTLIADTNSILHYSFFEIRWRDLFEADRIFVVLPLAILKELAKLKDQGEPKAIRKRAASRVKAIHGLIKGESSPIELREGEFLDVEQTRPAFPDDLNEKFADDWLIATALHMQSGKSNDLLVLTGDLALKVQLMNYQIKAKEIDSSFRHELPDNEEKKIRELEGEIRKLKSAQPHFKVCFSNGETFLKHTRRDSDAQMASAKSMAQSFLDKEKEGRPLKKVPAPRTFTMYGSTETVTAYNDELEKYYDRYLDWAEKACFICSWRFVIEIDIENKGAAPANSVSAWFHFPDGFIAFEERELMEHLPETPQPPKEPFSGIRSLQYDRNAVIRATRKHATTRSFRIRETNSYEIDFEIEKIRQGEKASLNEVQVLFSEEPSSFQIDYRVICDNITEPVEGTLHVIFEEPANK